MKKNRFFKAALSTIASSLFLVIFAGCFNTVFYDIRGDVEPEDATVSGNLTSITRYTINDTEFLVTAADGGVRYKGASHSEHGAWKSLSKDSLPFSPHEYDYFSETHNGEQLLKILADSTTLYLITASYTNDYTQGTTIVDKVKLYGIKINSFTKGSDGYEVWDEPNKEDWTVIVDSTKSSTYFPTYSYSYYNYTAFSIFQTNAPKKEHRQVFIRSGDTDALGSDYTTVSYYQLSALEEPQEITANVTPQEVLLDSSVKSNATSAVWFGGDVIFFNTMASTTNETYTSPASYFYYSNGEYVYYSDAAGSKKDSVVDAGAKVSALMTCSDALIIGRGNFASTSTSSSSSGGVRKTTLTDGIPGTKLVDFSTNASFQISSAYFVTALINATPDKGELESDLYAAITYISTGSSSGVSYKNKGLWSYYPSRGNWNRE